MEIESVASPEDALPPPPPPLPHPVHRQKPMAKSQGIECLFMILP
jgi:hypothetical protein